MNVFEFVNKYGLDKTKQAVQLKASDFENTFKIDKGFIIVRRHDLKQIVEAFELVAKYGGLNEAKELHYDEFRSDTTYNELQKAINLAEQCQ